MTTTLSTTPEPAATCRRLAIARPIRWSPDASFRERDQELGPELTVPVFAPDGTLTELPGGVLAVLSAFGAGATAAEVCERLRLPGEQAGAVAAFAATLEQRGFLTAGEPAGSPAAPPAAPPPLFLVTAHGCGGTLLRLLVDSHPRLACASPHRLGNGLRDLVDQAAQTDAFPSLELDHGAGVRALGAVAGDLLALHARLRQKDGWVWASRDHDLCLEFLDQAFDRQARFLCLVRHPLDAAASSAARYERTGWHAARMIERRRRHDEPRVAYAHYWVSVFERVRAFREAHPERVHVTRYEDLVRDPHDPLTQAFGFCGLAAPPSIVADALARPHEMLEGGWESFAFEGASGVRADQVGLWRAWDDRAVAAVEAVVADEMRGWGYRWRAGISPATCSSRCARTAASRSRRPRAGASR